MFLMYIGTTLMRRETDDADEDGENQEAENGDAAPARVASWSFDALPDPIPLRSSRRVGQRQFIQIPTARPTRLPSGTNSTPSKRLSLLLSRLSPIMK